MLVGNDTGGVVTQLVAVHHPERLGALVLTSCDAFEHFPPPILKPVILAAKSKTLFRTAVQAMRAPVARKRAFDGLAYSDIDALTELWVRPVLSDPAVAEDLRQFTFSMRTEVTTGDRPGSRVRQAGPDRVVGSRHVLRARGRRTAGRDHPERPAGGHPGSADILDGRSAGPARRSLSDDRGARLAAEELAARLIGRPAVGVSSLTIRMPSELRSPRLWTTPSSAWVEERRQLSGAAADARQMRGQTLGRRRSRRCAGASRASASTPRRSACGSCGRRARPAGRSYGRQFRLEICDANQSCRTRALRGSGA